MNDADFLEERVYEENAGQRGMKWLGRLLAVIVILVIFAFGDVMYLQLMTPRFPSGPLLILCYIGAFSSFLAIVYMLIGKSVLFSPGKQMVLSWLFLAIELATVAMNIILVFQGTANPSGFLQFWFQLAPATPVLNMSLVAILYFLDEEQARRHSDLELQNAIDGYDRKYIRELHKSRTKLKMRQLDYVSKALEQAVNSQESLDYIAGFGADMNTTLLQNLTGKPAPQISAPRSIRPVVEKVVEADKPKQIAPFQPRPRVLDMLKQVVTTSTPAGVKAQAEQREAEPEVVSLAQTAAQPVPAPQPGQVDRHRQMVEQRRRRRQQFIRQTAAPVVQPAPVPQPAQPTPTPEPAAQPTQAEPPTQGTGAPQAKNARPARARRAKQGGNTPTK